MRYVHPMTDQPPLPPHPDFAHKEIPQNAVLGDFLLQMLTPRDVVEDYKAVISAADYISGVFEGDWPIGLTLSQNLSDLTRHEREFAQRRSYAWIIRDADGLYIGCAYLFPQPGTAGSATGHYWMANVPGREALRDRFGRLFEPWACSLCEPECQLSFRSK